MNKEEYKTFEDIKEEFGKDYDYKLYEMGISAMKEIERLNNIINELGKYIFQNYEYYTGVNDVSLAIKRTYKDLLDKLKELKEVKE